MTLTAKDIGREFYSVELGRTVKVVGVDYSEVFDASRNCLCCVSNSELKDIIKREVVMSMKMICDKVDTCEEIGSNNACVSHDHRVGCCDNRNCGADYSASCVPYSESEFKPFDVVIPIRSLYWGEHLSKQINQGVFISAMSDSVDLQLTQHGIKIASQKDKNDS